MADDQSHNILADSVAKTACHKCGSVVDVSSEPAFSTITCPQCSAQFTAPGRLGGFVLLKELGKGEMGATYKAYEKSLGRYVAIKVMHGELGQDPARVDGFMSEGRALASLDNPNIVRVFSLGQEKDQLYIAMELISGGGMEKKFSKEKPLGEVPALEIITGVARALKAAGQIGLIHGDVKPENIMLSDKGRPKLVDFGIARFGGGKIAEGDALGTPYYVAPEQVERGSVDHRADIYSLGATMYHALAGEAPFTGDSLMKVLYVRIEGPVPDITKVRQDLHPETVEVLAHMLQKNPDDRYATYDDLLKDLLKACWAAGAEIIQDAEEAIPVAEKLTGPDWHRLIWPLAGFGAVIVAAVLWFVFFRGSTPPPEPKPDPTPVVMKVGDPKLSRRGGPISGPTSVTITCNTPAARIYYTTDGSVPTVDSQLYGGAITVSPGDTLRARAFRDGWDKSSVVEAEYTRDKAVLTDVVGIRADAGAAWGKVKQLDRAQGFGDKIDQGAKLYSQASDLYDKEAYSACKPLYASLVKLCAELNKLQAQRIKAAEAQTAAGAARRMIDEANTRWVRPNTRKIDNAVKQGKALFDKGQFDEAQAKWNAVDKLAEAELASVVAKVAKAFEDNLKKYKVQELDKFGGDSWTQAKAALARTRSAQTSQDRATAAKECGKAIDSLSKIAAEAATAARNQAANVASASKAKEIKERLQAARKLMADGQLLKAMEEVKALLKLDGRNREITDLRAKIEKRRRSSLAMGEIQIDNRGHRGPNIELAWIPAGEFNMGSPATESGRSSAEKLHKVQISKAFYIGVMEINRHQYDFYNRARVAGTVESGVKKFVRIKGRQPDNHERNKIKAFVNKNDKDLRKKSMVKGWNGKRWSKIKNGWWNNPGMRSNNGSPVTCVNWTQADAFCKWLSKQTGKTVRLPTEAEWEMACRAGTQTAYSFGDDPAELHKYGNYADKASKLPESDPDQNDGQQFADQCGRRAENPWKLKDMHGGVAEWCYDRSGVYRPGNAVDPTGPGSGLQRIVRGGSWFSLPKACRSAARNALSPITRDAATGFRIVVEIAN